METWTQLSVITFYSSVTYDVADMGVLQRFLAKIWLKRSLVVVVFFKKVIRLLVVQMA